MSEDKIKAAEQALIAYVRKCVNPGGSERLTELGGLLRELDEAKSPLPSMDDVCKAHLDIPGIVMLLAGPFWLRWAAMEGLESFEAWSEEGGRALDEYKVVLLARAKELEERTQ